MKEEPIEAKAPEDKATPKADKKVETNATPKKKEDLEKKLLKDGAVRVGKPDKLPAVKKTKVPSEVDG